MKNKRHKEFWTNERHKKADFIFTCCILGLMLMLTLGVIVIQLSMGYSKPGADAPDRNTSAVKRLIR